MTELILKTQRAVYSRGPAIAAGAAGLVLLALVLHGARDLEAALSGTVQRLSPMAATLLATLCTALATGAGAIPVIVARQVSARTQTLMMGFAAGVMLSASIFSLILPALSSASGLTGSKTGGGLLTGAALLLGAGLLLILDRVVPHEHEVQGVHGTHAEAIRRVWLFVFAITLHNVPEGLAIGVSFAGEGVAAGMPLAFGIGLQNLPEGLAVALAMLTLRYTAVQAALIALATGLVEPLGGLLGAGAISFSGALLPWGLGFAAGAMLFVISHEIIPESHRNGRETLATVGLFGGFVLMMLFDTVLS